MPHTTNYWMTFIRFRFLSAFGLQVNDFCATAFFSQKKPFFFCGVSKADIYKSANNI